MCNLFKILYSISFKEGFIIKKKELQVNEEIKDADVRVIDDDGSQLGLMKTETALDLAFSKNLDLVKIAPTAVPPVCKVMDYGKFKFEQTKKEKEAKKNQKSMDLKEIRLSINIDVNDFNTKVKNAIKFLKAGNRVKVTVRFRGREMSKTDFGYELLKKFELACQDFGITDKAAKTEGRNIILTLTPRLSE